MGRPDDSVQSGLYGAASAQDEYALEPGVCVLPLAESPPESEGELADWSPIVILRLHAPYRVRTTSFASAKSNNPPVVTTPQDAGKFVFVAGSILFETALNTTFGTFDWGVGGQYVYVENCVSRPRDGFVLTSAPFSWSSDVQNVRNFGQAAPSVGAVSEAGVNAVSGYNVGQSVVGQGPDGKLVTTWGYNSPSFFPGTFLNDDLANGGGTGT